MLALKDLLVMTVNRKASDLHITVGLPPILRIDGKLTRIQIERLTPDDTKNYAKEILGEKYDEYLKKGEIDISYSVAGTGRFRVNVYKQRGSDAIALRAVSLKVPTIDELGLPKILKDLTNERRGLILVTGPTGSGKSTTLAAMINEINNKRSEHIITLEDPIEYLHRHNKSIINQREIGRDSGSYASALRASLREDPDVILIGEMRDLETISIAVTAAETGHLVFSTLHTIGASKTIDRIVDVFPPFQQQQIKVELADVLQGIISQQLLPRSDNSGRIAALEIMIITSAIRNLIREGKTYQIESLIQTGSKYGMKTMDMSLIELYRKGYITNKTALDYSIENNQVRRAVMF